VVLTSAKSFTRTIYFDDLDRLFITSGHVSCERWRMPGCKSETNDASIDEAMTAKTIVLHGSEPGFSEEVQEWCRSHRLEVPKVTEHGRWLIQVPNDRVEEAVKDIAAELQNLHTAILPPAGDLGHVPRVVGGAAAEREKIAREDAPRLGATPAEILRGRQSR
jgi:hypothetical protein